MSCHCLFSSFIFTILIYCDINVSNKTLPSVASHNMLMYVTWLSTRNKHIFTCQPSWLTLWLCQKWWINPCRIKPSGYQLAENSTQDSCRLCLFYERREIQRQWRNTRVRRCRGLCKTCIKNGVVSTDKPCASSKARCTTKTTASKSATSSCGSEIKG